MTCKAKIGLAIAGLLLVSIILSASHVAACSLCRYQFSWGSTGSDDGQLHSPQGIAIDSAGDVYVADQGNARIDKFTDTGAYLTQWGSFGPGKGQFYDPYGVAVSASGRVYVTDYLKNQVEVFTRTGTFVTQWGSNDTEPGTGSGLFDSPTGIAVDSAGNVYVADYHNDRVQKFDGAGNYLSWFSLGYELRGPVGVAVSSSGNVYVTDASNDRVVEYGASFTTWGYSTWGSPGSGNGQFNYTQGIAVDSSGNVYVVDNGNSRVEKFTGSGVYITQWSTAITSSGHFSPQGITIDSSGNVYVTISVDDRIERFGDLPATTSTTEISKTSVALNPSNATSTPPFPDELALSLGSVIAAMVIILATAAVAIRKRRNGPRK